MDYFINIIFFGVLNFLMYQFLTRKLKLNTTVVLGLFVLLFLVFIVIQVGFIGGMPQNKFYLLILFSCSLILFHFGSASVLWILSKINPKIKDHFVLVLFNFLRFYVVYFLIYIFQISYIFIGDY